MKFWKILSGLIEQMIPDWRDKFLNYKNLKKQLKMIYPTDDEIVGGRPCKRMKLEVENKEVIDFVKLLEKEILKFNAFFTNKEEDYVIRSEVLQKRVEKARSTHGDLLSVGREIVDFHGELVLLENYSALNYIGLVKILKKYDKRSGAVTRVAFIQKVLEEPFVTIDILNKLVKDCEKMLDHLFSVNEHASSSQTDQAAVTNAASGSNETTLRVPNDMAEIEHMENMYVKLTTSAYQVLKEIRGGSSTVSMFSLPPMQTNNEPEEVWRQIPVEVEQAAK